MTLVLTLHLYTSWVSSLCEKKGHIGGRVSDHCLKNFVSNKDPSYVNNTEYTKTWALQSPLWWQRDIIFLWYSILSLLIFKEGMWQFPLGVIISFMKNNNYIFFVIIFLMVSPSCLLLASPFWILMTIQCYNTVMAPDSVWQHCLDIDYSRKQNQKFTPQKVATKVSIFPLSIDH